RLLPDRRDDVLCESPPARARSSLRVVVAQDRPMVLQRLVALPLLVDEELRLVVRLDVEAVLVTAPLSDRRQRSELVPPLEPFVPTVRGYVAECGDDQTGHAPSLTRMVHDQSQVVAPMKIAFAGRDATVIETREVFSRDLGPLQVVGGDEEATFD